ncbi:MAG: HlyD family efflux transporter periplasmic adaptor subunit [Rhizobacter sp.]|nr:HlyD family efflux transporter periplasmic adaptor subunit [Rhizobacter sp.]
MGEPLPRSLAEAWGAFGLPSDETPTLRHGGPVLPRLEPAPAAFALYAKVLSATTLAGAAHGLVAMLAADFGFARATLGLHEEGRTRLLASSGADINNPQGELPQRLLGAMDEAIEQAFSLAWPVADHRSLGARSDAVADAPADASDTATDPIRIEHRMLQALVGGAVASVPLGRGGETFGALCVERDGTLPIDRAELARLEQLMALAVPALRWMQHGTEPWHRRMRRELAQAWAALRQPDKRGKRRLLAALALALAVLAVAPLEQAVGGRARVEGAEQRVLAAPADGFVKAAHVRPGDRVKAGDALVDLVEGDLRLERERWTSQLAQHENAYAAAMGRSDRATAATSLSRISEAQSQLALVDEQLLRGRVTAPFDAVVIQGDLSQAIGTPVRQGDTLITLAASGRYRVIVDVDETDIGRVQVGQGGQVSLSSLPWGGETIVVERIAPLAKAVEGRNVFEVEASLPAPPADLRPGLLGRAELVIGRSPPLWAWAGHALDRLRVAWWSWLG